MNVMLFTGYLDEDKNVVHVRKPTRLHKLVTTFKEVEVCVAHWYPYREGNVVYGVTFAKYDFVFRLNKEEYEAAKELLCEANTEYKETTILNKLIEEL